MLPMYLWFWTGEPLFRSPWLVAPWVAFVAVLMVSSIATFSWSSLQAAPQHPVRGAGRWSW